MCNVQDTMLYAFGILAYLILTLCEINTVTNYSNFTEETKAKWDLSKQADMQYSRI